MHTAVKPAREGETRETEDVETNNEGITRVRSILYARRRLASAVAHTDRLSTFTGKRVNDEFFTDCAAVLNAGEPPLPRLSILDALRLFPLRSAHVPRAKFFFFVVVVVHFYP